jgi:hypothetical protein
MGALSGGEDSDGNKTGGAAAGVTALGKGLGPLMSAMQTRPATQLPSFPGADSSFVAPPQDQMQALLATMQQPNAPPGMMGAQPQQRSAFYGG